MVADWYLHVIIKAAWARYVKLEIYFLIPVKLFCKYATFSGYKKLFLKSIDFSSNQKIKYVISTMILNILFNTQKFQKN